MTEPGTRPRSPRDLRLELTFRAFFERHHKVWLRYAHVQAGSRAAAEAIVEDTALDLARTWAYVLERPSVAAHSWKVFKDHVARWLAQSGQRPCAASTAAFAAAARKTKLFGLQDQFSLLENELGLYTAISRLPERQYDLIVLRYVLGVKDGDIADYLDIGATAVAANVGHARGNLAKQLTTLVRDEDR